MPPRLDDLFLVPCCSSSQTHPAPSLAACAQTGLLGGGFARWMVRPREFGEHLGDGCARTSLSMIWICRWSMQKQSSTVDGLRFYGVQLTIGTNMVSALHCDVSPRRGAAASTSGACVAVNVGRSVRVRSRSIGSLLIFGVAVPWQQSPKQHSRRGLPLRWFWLQDEELIVVRGSTQKWNGVSSFPSRSFVIAVRGSATYFMLSWWEFGI